MALVAAWDASGGSILDEEKRGGDVVVAVRWGPGVAPVAAWDASGGSVFDEEKTGAMW